MSRHPKVIALVTLMLVSVLLPALLKAQPAEQPPPNTDTKPAAATDITAAEIAQVFAALQGGVDKQIKVADIGGGANAAVGILHRGATRSDGDAVRGLVHHKVAEVYYVLDGSGTLVTGGTVSDRRELDPTSATVRELVGPSLGGASQGGVSREISQGDIVVIPAGVFHGFSHIADHISYLSIRVDPDQVLPAGYVSPVLEPR